MWAVMADEDHAARVLVDRVHNPEHTRCLPPPSVIVIAFRLPPFEREVLGVSRAAEAETGIVLRFHGCR
jgi:hypothetical protein